MTETLLMSATWNRYTPDSTDTLGGAFLRDDGTIKVADPCSHFWIAETFADLPIHTVNGGDGVWSGLIYAADNGVKIGGAFENADEFNTLKSGEYLDDWSREHNVLTLRNRTIEERKKSLNFLSDVFKVWQFETLKADQNINEKMEQLMRRTLLQKGAYRRENWDEVGTDIRRMPSEPFDTLPPSVTYC
jgi:hypothetical protein